MKNFIIDAVESLASASNLQDRWQLAVDLSQQIGLNNILVAKVDCRLKLVDWVNTNLPDSWMEEYLQEGYINVDPLVENLTGRSGTIIMKSGSLKKEDARSSKAYACDHGLKHYGFDSLKCTRFEGRDGFGTNVTLFSSQSIEEMHASSPIDLEIYSALLSTAIGGPVDSFSNQLLKSKILPQRQREVLSLLAEGRQTARISEALGITEAAVNKHFAAARRNLGAVTREQALAIALQRGLLDL